MVKRPRWKPTFDHFLALSAVFYFLMCLLGRHHEWTAFLNGLGLFGLGVAVGRLPGRKP